MADNESYMMGIYDGPVCRAKILIKIETLLSLTFRGFF